MSKLRWIFLALLLAIFTGTITAAADDNGPLNSQSQKPSIHCPASSPSCADISSAEQDLLEEYSGHDEPAIAFYSNRPGSGNNFTTILTLPKDPPTAPQQDGSGGTFSFQLHPAFWFSMILCDTQSAPNFTHVCIPNSDANIFDNGDPNAPDFIGRHPGSAFLELQFYPPGGLNTCSDPSQWCVAMVIFSFNIQEATGARNNRDCAVKVGLEPANFAFLTTNGISQFLAGPLSSGANPLFATVPGQLLKMNPGDKLRVTVRDTADGLRAEIHDLTLGIKGSMTASIANGFAQVNFVPDPDPLHPSVTCSSSPYAFHPQYSTASEHTRAVWTAHTVSVAFSDEIGHYELCSAVDREGGRCIGSSPADPAGPDSDNRSGCFSGSLAGLFGLQPIGACIGTDQDFDGTPYHFNWPGTGDSATDALIHSTPIRFTSPRFREHRAEGDADRKEDGDGGRGPLRSFSRVAFETDTPISETITNPTCNRLTGSGCTNPPAGTQFYPIYSTIRHSGGDDDEDEVEGGCSWQLGGPNIPGTENNFGGTATSEYGGPLFAIFPTLRDANHPNGNSIALVDDFRRVIPNNPCSPRQDGDHAGGKD